MAAADHRPEYERSDASLRLIAAIGAGLALFLLATPAVIQTIWRLPLASLSQPPRVAAPPPRLQTDPAAEMAAYRRAQKAVLSGYGWIDRPAGIARIPIDTAIDLFVEQSRTGWTGEKR